MTKAGRIGAFLSGLVIMFVGLLITSSPWSAYMLALFTIGVYLLANSIRQFVFYIKMARHMVGGRTTLYGAIINFDLAIFTISLNDLSPVYVMLFLIILHAFQGGIGIMGAMETRRAGGHWKIEFIRSLVDVLIAILCICFIQSVALATFIYGLGLVYSGIIRIIGAFRKSAIVYIQ